MDPATELVRRVEINLVRARYVLTLNSEDFSALYPGMVRYTLTLTEAGRMIAVFRTNSFEYSPLVPLAAENVAKRTADEWEREIRNNPMNFILNHHQEFLKHTASPMVDLVVIQGSPRANGNCSIPVSYTHLTLPTNREV